MSKDSIISQIIKPNSTKKETMSLVKNLLIFLLAGFDTLSHEMTNITYRLHKHPEQWEKLNKEIESILNNKIENISKESLEKFEFLNLFIKECQRIDGVATASFNL